MEQESRAWSVIGKLVAIVAAIVVTAIIRGSVLTILWGWFIEPLGVVSINIALAIGIALIVGMLTQREDDEAKKKVPASERFATALVVSIFGAAFALLIGWIVHFFV